jgi:hypothetical protein
MLKSGRWSRGPTFGDFVTIRTEVSMQDITVARLQITRVQTPLSPSFQCNLMRESLTMDGQNISCETLKRRGSWVICVSLVEVKVMIKEKVFGGQSKVKVRTSSCSSGFSTRMGITIS